MKVPNAKLAFVDQTKIIDYLLDPDHLYGGPKARLLLALGYSPDRWQQLAIDLLTGLQASDFLASVETRWGTRYVVAMALNTPSTKIAQFQTIWQIDLGTDVPRLITIYPE